MSISESLAGDFEHELAGTRKVLEACPEEKFAWQPHEKSMTLGMLASHLAENPAWGESMLKEDLDFGEMMKDYQPFLAASKTELLEAFDRNAATLLKAVSNADDATLQEIWTATKGDQVLMQMPRHTAIRGMTIHHMIHHRGQLTVFLRLLDVPVPSTFGPSADDPGGF